MIFKQLQCIKVPEAQRFRVGRFRVPRQTARWDRQGSEARDNM